MTDKQEQKSAEQIALQAYVISLCKTEIELFRDRKYWKTDEAISSYFQSTPHKAAFGRLMTKATLVSECYSIKEISDQLNLTRQSVYRMVRDCLDAGWIEVCSRSCNGGQKEKYIGSQGLVKSTYSYADYLIKTLIKTDVLDSELLVAAMMKHRIL